MRIPKKTLESFYTNLDVLAIFASEFLSLGGNCYTLLQLISYANGICFKVH